MSGTSVGLAEEQIVQTHLLHCFSRRPHQKPIFQKWPNSVVQCNPIRRAIRISKHKSKKCLIDSKLPFNELRKSSFTFILVCWSTADLWWCLSKIAQLYICTNWWAGRCARCTQGRQKQNNNKHRHHDGLKRCPFHFYNWWTFREVLLWFNWETVSILFFFFFFFV